MIARYRVKAILFVSLVLGVLRYALCGMGDLMDQLWFVILGVMLHGITWTFFVEAGRVFIDRRVEAGLKGQAQALMSFVTGGLGGFLGILFVKSVHAKFVLASGGAGWAAYWGVLSVACLMACILFGVFYRGAAKP